MATFEKGQTVTHPSIDVEMKVTGEAGLGAGTSHGKVVSHTIGGRTTCEYYLDGRRRQKGFPTNELIASDLDCTE